jgi:uncharacterized protein YndB with AHSA1/START domain
MTLPTAEEAEATRMFIKAAGGNATWDRLAEYLNEKERGQHSFVINRSFAAPIDLLFEMWAEPNHLSKWLPPVGFEMDILRTDFRDGGHCFFRMSNRADVTFYGKFEYREITKPCRIVYVQRFCDEIENAARHPALPVFPEAMLITVLFAAEGDLATRVTVTSVPLGMVSAEENIAFTNTRSGMTQGWTGAFDKLEAMIAMVAKDA